MKNIDEIMVRDAILTLENESAFYTFFFQPYTNNLKKIIDKGVYSNARAVNGLQEQIRSYFKSCQNLYICKHKYKYIPTIYHMTKNERIAVATGLIDSFELDNI